MIDGAVAQFLGQFKQWASAQAPIQAVALVGSYARGAATATSDVDLVILADEPGQYLAERAWTRTFGTPLGERLERYGNVVSLRVQYQDHLEVEFGFTDVGWAGGTARSRHSAGHRGRHAGPPGAYAGLEPPPAIWAAQPRDGADATALGGS